MRERDRLEALGIDGKTILKWMFEKRDGDMDWIDLTQKRDKWQTVVSAVMNPEFRRMWGNS
jgi:hypothetical protein